MRYNAQPTSTDGLTPASNREWSLVYGESAFNRQGLV